MDYSRFACTCHDARLREDSLGIAKFQDLVAIHFFEDLCTRVIESADG